QELAKVVGATRVAREHGKSAEVTLDVLREELRRPVPPACLFAERHHHDRVEIARERPLEPVGARAAYGRDRPRRRRVGIVRRWRTLRPRARTLRLALAYQLVQLALGAGPDVIRPTSSEQLIQHYAERVD